MEIEREIRMGDFEDVFGAGADSDGIVDGYSDAAMRYEQRENAKADAQWHSFKVAVFFDARIAAFGYSLYLENYEKVLNFDKIIQDISEYSVILFTRQRDGLGYRVIIKPESHSSHFTRPGRVIVTKSPEDAEAYSTQFGAPFFPLYKSEPIVINSIEPKPFDQYLDNGHDIVVFGNQLFNVLYMGARFIGWSPLCGFRNILEEVSLNSYEFKPSPPLKPHQLYTYNSSTCEIEDHAQNTFIADKYLDEQWIKRISGKNYIKIVFEIAIYVEATMGRLDYSFVRSESQIRFDEIVSLVRKHGLSYGDSLEVIVAYIEYAKWVENSS